MTSISKLDTQKRGSMTLPAVPLIKRPALTMTHPAALDYPAMALSFFRLSSFLLALVFLACLIIPELQIGLLRVLQLDTARILPQIEDMAQRRIIITGVFAGLFMADVWQRKITPLAWEHTTSLSGYGVLAVAAVWYFIQGQLTIIGLVLYAGPFALSLMVMAAIIHRSAPTKWTHWIDGNTSRLISTLFALLAVGLWTQPFAALTEFLSTQIGGVMLALMLVLFVWGHAQLRHNHLPAWKAYKRVAVMLLFAGMWAYFLGHDPMASLLGFVMALYLSLLIALTVNIQAYHTPLSQEAKS